MAARQIINGGFQAADGSALALGTLKFRLNTDAVTSGNEQIVAGRIVSVPLDSSGNVSGTVDIWPNDQLTPTDTVYIVTAISARGEISWRSEQVIPSGVGSFDLNTWIP
jgi:hypothetical protein